MKLVTFLNDKNEERTGIFTSNRYWDMAESASQISKQLPNNMIGFLNAGEAAMDTARKVETAANEGKIDSFVENVRLLAPVPHPTSCRDGYAFRQHVATARRNRGVDMIPEFDQYPVFYFTNHNAVMGPGDLMVEKDHLERLDFELEAAVVIGKRGKNVSSSEADAYIAGYTIMNDFSARTLQMEEMKLNLGPAKGKDFATAIGPWLVTPDEFEDRKKATDFGAKYSLRMTASHNGKQISDGNLDSMNWTFAEIVERCAYGVEIFPGDVIGSGTVGTGCYLELNGTWRLEAEKAGKEFTPTWLQNGDTITLEIERLGVLEHKIVQSAVERSILAKKKNG